MKYIPYPIPYPIYILFYQDADTYLDAEGYYLQVPCVLFLLEFHQGPPTSYFPMGLFEQVL